MEIGSKNLEFRTDDTENIVLEDGTYTAGQVVVEGETEYSFTGIDDAKRAFVLLEDVETDTDGKNAVGATGVFNANVVTLSDGDLTPELNAMLQKKGIILKTSIKG